MDMKPTGKPLLSEVALQWDQFASERFGSISRGEDTSYVNQLMPFWAHELSDLSCERALDLGCGVGFLTREIAKMSKFVIGIDPSERSIEIAQRENFAPNIQYSTTNASDFSKASECEFDFIACNMVLMDAPDLQEIFASAFSIQRIGGRLLSTIANPTYWPRYWGYEKEKWFDYNEELFIDVEFTTSGTGGTGRRITHIHRPLSMYLQKLHHSGYILEWVKEFGPSTQAGHGLFPKFLALMAQKL